MVEGRDVSSDGSRGYSATCPASSRRGTGGVAMYIGVSVLGLILLIVLLVILL
jgi:hypothetical protein